MRLMLVHYVYEDRGSAQDVHNYAQAARTLGHEVVLYGRENPASPFNYSMDLKSADAVVFIFEWTTTLQDGDALDMARMVASVPRARRVVIDCDGKYNDAISVVGDCNHRSDEISQQWVAVCDSLSDKIYQPTYHPLRSNVGTFFFHAYNPDWEVPFDFTAKDYGMFYVGHNWFRWRPMKRILEMIEPIRTHVGRIGIVGHGWGSPPPWANPSITADAYYSDATYLEKLNVEVKPAIGFGQVITAMSAGVFTPVIYRPLFNHLKLVTCRSFETPAANTIPLFGLEEAYVQELYGDEAVELVLDGNGSQERILDVRRRPDYYAEIVKGIRRRLADRHSYVHALERLIEIVNT